MAFQVNGVEYLGTGLQQLLMADSIVPGVQAGYEVCKQIYAYHPHGAKIADSPIAMAMYKEREITVPNSPADGADLVDAFKRESKALRRDAHVFNAARLARVYGVSTLGLMVRDADTTVEVNFKELHEQDIVLTVWDPLNTAGSIVLNQDPNAMDFQKTSGVSVAGKPYHRSRVCPLMNEDPMYILYETAAFGFSGRSVYQRALVPMKSYIMTLATDMMIALKAGVLVAKMKSQSSAIDEPMRWIFSQKREMVKEAQTGNILSIDIAEDIVSLNMQQLEGPYKLARSNIIENEAAASGTPAKLLLSDTFAEGFGEGTEDAKSIAQFVEGVRTWMQPLYDFTDEIVMYRAWNADFFAVMQNKYPEAYAGVSYEVAFNDWRNSFTAQWPNLLEEPESEKLEGEDVVLKAIIALFEILAPEVPQDQKAVLIEWVMNNINEKKLLFSSPLELDIGAIAEYEPPAAEPELKKPAVPKPEASADSAGKRARKEKWTADDQNIRDTALAVLRGKPVAANA